MSKPEYSTLQKEIIERFKFEDHGALLLDVGVGKTSTTIGIYEEKLSIDSHKRILILAPSTVVPNWEREFKKFYPSNPLPIHTSFGSKSSRKKDLSKFVEQNKEGIIVTNYEIATSSLGPIIAGWEPTDLVFDEAQNLKNPKSKRAKFFLSLRKKATGCFILTGTIIANKVTDAFMPYLIMDLGKTFGTNFWVFQRKYMYDANERWAGNPGYFPNWKIRTNMLPEFKEKLSQNSVTVSRKDALKDLPPLIKENRYVELSKEQAKAYKDLSKILITELNDQVITVENALTKVLRLNQICAGHIGKGEELVVFQDTEKDKEFKNIIEEIKERDEKVIIWTVFKEDVVRVTRLLKECGVTNPVFITGSETGEEKAASEIAFQTDDSVKHIVCNLQAGNAGINLQAARNSINFSRDFSFIKAYQSEARNHRRGSEIHDSIIQYNIIVKDSIEEEIMEAVEKKKELSDYVLDQIENLSLLEDVEKELKNKILKEFIRG